MRPIPINAICAAVNGRVHGNPRGTVTGVSTDSRRLSPGDAFFALAAQRDGHEFVGDAFDAGASVAIVSKPLAVSLGKTAILVEDTLQALGALATWYRLRMPATVVGITGSNGKTTTKEMLARVLAAVTPTIKSPESFNNAIGVPHTLFRLESFDRYAVVEMGTNAHGEIRRLARIARPQVGIITNVAPTHLEGLGTIKGVAEEKGCLIESLPESGTAVLNADNHWCREIAARSHARVVTFGIEEPADVRARSVEPAGTGTRFEALGTAFTIPAPGRHNVYNALAALAAGVGLGLEPGLVRDQLARFRLPPMRMERVEIGGVTIFNDAYNANFESMLAALTEYARLAVHGRKVVVCGDMLELGDQSPAIHREVGKRIAVVGFDVLVSIGREALHLAAGAADNGMPRQQIFHCSGTDAARQLLPELLERGDTLLLKASRKMGLDALVEVVADWGPPGGPVRTEAAEETYHTFRAPATSQSVRT